MKLHLTTVPDKQLITSYGEGWVEINRIRFSSSLIVTPDNVEGDCGIDDFDHLTARHFEHIAGLKPEVVLLGSGRKQRFIHPQVSHALTDAGISMECMDTAAACRTYNFLMAEGRRVVALLIIQ